MARRRYTACPKCAAPSLRVEENGRICRHTEGLGSVEHYPKGHPFIPGPLCKGSGLQVMEPVLSPG